MQVWVGWREWTCPERTCDRVGKAVRGRLVNERGENASELFKLVFGEIVGDLLALELVEVHAKHAHARNEQHRRVVALGQERLDRGHRGAFR